MSSAVALKDIDKEVWREHPRIKKILCSSSGKIINRHTLKEYKGCKNADGYLRTTINEEGITFRVIFHRAIAESHIGISSLTVNHINGNKTDNRVDNLEYLTRADNVRHACKTGLRNNRSFNVHNSSLDIFKALTLATFHNAGYGQDLLAEIMRMKRSTIGGIVKGKTYKNISFIFNILEKDQHNKYTKRSLKSNKWVLFNKHQREAL